MSRFIVEHVEDDASDSHYVVELSEDPNLNGAVVGIAEDSDVAREAADYINQHGHQPSALAGYDIRETF